MLLSIFLSVAAIIRNAISTSRTCKGSHNANPPHSFNTARSGGLAMRDEHLTLITAQKAALMHLVPLCAGQLVELIKGKMEKKKASKHICNVPQTTIKATANGCRADKRKTCVKQNTHKHTHTDTHKLRRKANKKWNCNRLN